MKTFPTRTEMVAEYIKPDTTGAEIGVYRGDFSQEIYSLCRPKMLYLIDAWQKYQEYEKDSLCHTNQDGNYNDTKSQMAHAIKAGRCEVIRGFSAAVAKSWTGPKLKWIFLDSIHTFPFVLEDLREWSKHMTEDGVIMMHDYTERAAALAMDFGVIKACAQFCEESGWEVFAVTQEGDWPSAAIRRK